MTHECLELLSLGSSSQLELLDPVSSKVAVHNLLQQALNALLEAGSIGMQASKGEQGLAKGSTFREEHLDVILHTGPVTFGSQDPFQRARWEDQREQL